MVASKIEEHLNATKMRRAHLQSIVDAPEFEGYDDVTKDNLRADLLRESIAENIAAHTFELATS
jgi:hypothetical protein